MKRTALVLLLVAGLATSRQPVVVGQPSAAGADLEAGIRQVREGEFDLAIITLDGVVKQLSREGGRARQLARAYTYLAIAYVGLAQQEKAKAQFLEAWKADRGFVLSPKEFPPSVIELFEQAKKEGQAEAKGPATAGPRSPAGAPPAAQPAGKSGHTGAKGPLIIAGAAAVAGGVVVAATRGSSGGGGGGGPENPDLPTGTVTVVLTLNDARGGIHSCSRGLFFRITASSTRVTTVEINRFTLAFASNSPGCATHEAPVSTTSVSTLSPGASDVQLRQVDLAGDLCTPPYGSPGCQWTADLTLSTSAGQYGSALQFQTAP
jgi:hypothetical protein